MRSSVSIELEQISQIPTYGIVNCPLLLRAICVELEIKEKAKKVLYDIVHGYMCTVQKSKTVV